ncbi:hypothetical protein BJ741DRAFT_602906 [Chytriomyces cf. hyalinus JEL632]|nr:hypothetical protein BJ741DRAFT_602906 [Chytriomyces cf. hyalinus JEL632]
MPVVFDVVPQDKGPSCSAVPPPLSSDYMSVVFDDLLQDEGLSCSAVPASFSSDYMSVVFDVLPQDEGPSCSAVAPPLQSVTIKTESDAAVTAPSPVLPSLQSLIIKMESDVAITAPKPTETPTVNLIPRPINPYLFYRSKRSNETLKLVLEERFKTEPDLKIKIDAFLENHPAITDLMSAMWCCMDASEQQVHHAEFKEECRQFKIQQEAIELGELLGFVGSNDDASSTKASAQSKRESASNVKQEQTSKQTRKPSSQPASKLNLEPDNVHSDTAVPAPKITAKPNVKKRLINSYHFFRSKTSNEELKLILQERFKTEPLLKIKIDCYRKEYPSRDLMNAVWYCMDASEKKVYRDAAAEVDQKDNQNKKAVALADDEILTFADSKDGESSSGSKRRRVTNGVKQEPASKRTHIPTSKPTSKWSLETPLEPSLEPNHLPVPPTLPSSNHLPVSPSVPSTSSSDIPPTVHQAPASASRDNNNCNIFHMNASFQSAPGGSHPWPAQPHPINALPTAYPWPVPSPHLPAQGHPFWMWNPADMWANPFASMMMTQATIQQQMLGLSFPQQSSGGSESSSATRNPFSLGFGLDANQQSDDVARVRNTWLQSIGITAQGIADKVGSSPPHRSQDACASSEAVKQETNDPAVVPDGAKGVGKSEGAISELSLAQFLKANAADKKSGLSADGIRQSLLKGKEFAWEDPENEGHVFTVPDYELTQELEQAISSAQTLDRYSMQFPVDKGQNVPVMKVETKPKPRPKRRVTTRQSKPADGENSSALPPATITPKKGQGRNNNNNDVDGNSEQERLRAENAFLLREIERLKK